MFLEFHILQSFPPSNLNRDDTNNPKDALFGGVRRARISSQAFKRAIRTSEIFGATLQETLAIRTRYIRDRWLVPALVKAGKGADEAKRVVELALPSFFVKHDQKGKNKQKGLRKEFPDRWDPALFLSPKERDYIASQLIENWEVLVRGDKAAVDKAMEIGAAFQKAFKRSKEQGGLLEYLTPDVALFGRMMADAPTLNVDAAVQVAHAISTHRIRMETDFFTAVDDLAEDETGAAMMDYTAYDSATFYRYIRLDWDQLLKNLGTDEEGKEAALRAVESFVRAMLGALPSGKQNAFAAFPMPDFVLCVVRKDGFAWSLVNAFEHPVRPEQGGGYRRRSIEALVRYWAKIVDVYGEDSVQAKVVLTLEDVPLGELQEAVVQSEMVDGKKIHGRERFIQRITEELCKEA